MFCILQHIWNGVSEPLGLFLFYRMGKTKGRIRLSFEGVWKAAWITLRHMIKAVGKTQQQVTVVISKASACGTESSNLVPAATSNFLVIF